MLLFDSLSKMQNAMDIDDESKKVIEIDEKLESDSELPIAIQIANRLEWKSNAVCPFPACTKFLKDHPGRHRRWHTNELFLCSHSGCDYSTSHSGTLKVHQRIHSQDKKYICGYPECEHKTTDKSALRTHQRIHTQDKKYVCEYPECEYKTINSSDLKTHQRTHTQDKKYVCEYPGCDYRTTNRSTLKTHQRRHAGDKKYVCEFPGCEYQTTVSIDLRQHHKSLHTPEGQARQKKKENRLYNALLKAGLKIDQREFHFSLQCIDSTFARFDFLIYKEEHINVIECQEMQHKERPTSCDFIRGSKIREALTVSGDTRNVVFCFFNPDSFKVDGKTTKVDYTKRVETLVKFLDQHKPDRPLTFVLFFYDMQDGRPMILSEPDFPKELLECVQWI